LGKAYTYLRMAECTQVVTWGHKFEEEEYTLDPVEVKEIGTLVEVQAAQRAVEGARGYLTTANTDAEELRSLANLLPPGARSVALANVLLFEGTAASANDAIDIQNNTAFLVSNLAPEAKSKPEVRESVYDTLCASKRIQDRSAEAAVVCKDAMETAVVIENPDLYLSGDQDALTFVDSKDPVARKRARDNLEEKKAFVHSNRFQTKLRTALGKLARGFKRHWDLCVTGLWLGLGSANLIAALTTGGGVMSMVAGGSVAAVVAWPVGVPALVLLLAGLLVCGGVVYVRRRKMKKALQVVPHAG